MRESPEIAVGDICATPAQAAAEGEEKGLDSAPWEGVVR